MVLKEKKEALTKALETIIENIEEYEYTDISIQITDTNILIYTTSLDQKQRYIL